MILHGKCRIFVFEKNEFDDSSGRRALIVSFEVFDVSFCSCTACTMISEILRINNVIYVQYRIVIKIPVDFEFKKSSFNACFGW